MYPLIKPASGRDALPQQGLVPFACQDAGPGQFQRGYRTGSIRGCQDIIERCFPFASEDGHGGVVFADLVSAPGDFFDYEGRNGADGVELCQEGPMQAGFGGQIRWNRTAAGRRQ
jgi:hypothetical protein